MRDESDLCTRETCELSQHAMRFSRARRENNHIRALEWFEHGCECEADGDLIEAARAYRCVIARLPEHAEAHFNLGNVMRALGEVSAAKRHFQRAVQCNQRFATAWYNLADVLDDCGNLSQAISCLERAIAADPLFADAYFNLADCCERAGQFAAAVRHWSRYLLFDPNSDWADEARASLTRCLPLHR